MNETPRLRVLLDFTRGTDALLDSTTEDVLDNLYGNAAFPTPPVVEADLTAALDLFRERKAAMAQGGTAATAAKNEQKRVLAGLMRTLALYVQETSVDVLSTLLSSGFRAASTNRAQSPLSTPEIRRIRIDGPGQRIVDVSVVDMAKCYEVNIALLDAAGTPGPYTTAGLFTRARGIRLSNLTPGQGYLIQARAIGGSTGYSNWSDAVASLPM
ncbi:hypothetical protein [Luteolibacter marinus]|uniref:hypothetical protein n=1 Tax=Luteolibacter marinus TaxID=2776705 RepID=UPI001865F864|nr:hypothetical protein [Luteolibacter marinus]